MASSRPAGVVAEQRLGGVEVRRCRLVLGVGQLQPTQPGVQVGALEGVDRPAQRERRAEGSRSLVVPADAPQHVGQLGLQSDGVGGHGRDVPLRHRQGGVEGRDRLVVGERVGRVIPGHLEVVNGPLGVFRGRVILAEDGGDLGQAR